MKLKDNNEKLKINTQLPHLIASVAEIFDLEDEENEDGSAVKRIKPKKKKELSLKLPQDKLYFFQ